MGAVLSLLLACAPRVVPPVVAPAADTPLAPDRAPRALTEAGLAQLLASPSDRPRVLNLWASWCGPCRAELPMFGALAAAHPEIDVVLVSVDDPADAAEAARLAAPTGLRLFLLGPDPAGILERVVPRWPRVVPVTLVVSPAGQELGRWAGSTDVTALSRVLGL